MRSPQIDTLMEACQWSPTWAPPAEAEGSPDSPPHADAANNPMMTAPKTAAATMKHLSLYHPPGLRLCLLAVHPASNVLRPPNTVCP